MEPVRRSELARGDPQPVRLGAYRLLERLGAGGHALVYRARRLDDPDATDVALKRLHPHLIGDPLVVQAFAREARIAYLLDHPVIRRVFALCRGRDELFMIMEYVDGLSLSRVLERVSAAGRRLPLAGVLAVLHRLCDGLHHAHELVDEEGAPAGLVHRDVSPSNLLVTAAGRLKLIDLGVVRSMSADHVTNSGLIKGKYGYMAPEVMAGAPFDRRADVYSAGVVAWELLTASKLFRVRNPSVDLARVRARPIEPPSLRNPACPPELDDLVLRALAADPADRWPTCAAMAKALVDVAEEVRLPLSDRAVADLAAAPVDPDDGAPTRPVPRSRLARGTFTEVPAVASPGGGRCRRCRRSFALGAAGGSGATILAALVGAYLSRAVPHPDVAAAQVTPPLEASPRVLAAAPEGPRDAGASAPPHDAAALGPPDVVIARGPPPVDGWPEVSAARLIRRSGPEPRSRSTTAPYRARLCIDDEGTVVSAAVLDGPERLKGRITWALLRWRFVPHREGDVARPVCTVVESRIRKLPRPR